MLSLEKIIQAPTPLVSLADAVFHEKGVRVVVKCDYETHPELSGNKWRKLKYNLRAAQERGAKKIVSFGGAYSNHIYSLGAVAAHSDFDIHAFIRGDELTPESNATLRYAAANGVHLHFVSRAEYRAKESLLTQFHEGSYLLPEGGSNQLALVGVSEMVDEILSEIQPTHICAAMGTGGTVAGIVSNKKFEGKVVGVPVLKGGFGLMSNVENLTRYDPARLEILTGYHFGGYGKSTVELARFSQDFTENYQIPLDSIYTAKLFYAVSDLIANGHFAPSSTVVVYHSGGLRF